MSETPFAPKMPVELAAALAQAQTAASAVEKRGRNTQQNYKYATAEDVIAEGREALSEAKLVLLPVSTRFVPIEGDLDANAGAIGYLDIVYMLVHAPSGHTHEIRCQEHVCPTRTRDGYWARPLDKAIFAARTEGLGYLIRELLLIPRQDAPDVSGRGDSDERPPRGWQERQQGQRGQDRGRGGQASPGPSRGAHGAPAQGGGQDPPPAPRAPAPPADPKLAEEVRLLRQRREEAAKEKSRDKILLADTAFAAFVEGYAATLREPHAVDALAAACTELRFPKGSPARDAIGAAINQARARIAAAAQTT